MIEKSSRRVKTSVCLLVSGGIDSSVLLAELARRGRTIFPIYIRWGLIWERAELYWLKKYIQALPRSLRRRVRPLTILDLPVVDLLRKDSHWAVSGQEVPGYKAADTKVYLPGRNLLFLSKAAVFCSLWKIQTLTIGSLLGNPFSDATPKFFKMLEKTAQTALGHPLRIVAPFRSLTKREVLQRGRGLPLHLCFSCLSPRGYRSCGRCNKCAERERARLEE